MPLSTQEWMWKYIVLFNAYKHASAYRSVVTDDILYCVHIRTTRWETSFILLPWHIDTCTHDEQHAGASVLVHGRQTCSAQRTIFDLSNEWNNNKNTHIWSGTRTFCVHCWKRNQHQYLTLLIITYDTHEKKKCFFLLFTTHHTHMDGTCVIRRVWMDIIRQIPCNIEISWAEVARITQ